MSAKASRSELSELVLDKLRRGICPSRVLWDPKCGNQSTHRPLNCDGEPFGGGTKLQLSLHAIQHGFESPHWLTADEAGKLGAQIRLKERGVTAFYCRSTMARTADYYNRIDRNVFFEQAEIVFNADQILGLPPNFHGHDDEIAYTDISDTAHQFFARIGAHVEYGDSNARYNPFSDRIGMPFPHEYIDGEAFTFALLHEHIHWTGHRTRLNRGLDRNTFGGPADAFEKLIAGLGSAFLCSELRIRPSVRDEHSFYLQSWLEQLKGDERAIYVAANCASDAIEYLNSNSFEASYNQ